MTGDRAQPQLIRVMATCPWPKNHSHAGTHPSGIGQKQPSADNPAFFLVGPPTEPDAHWTCGTDLVWPVYAINTEKVEAFLGRLPYVCRHQIQAGD
jgi:hypothetical protein